MAARHVSYSREQVISWLQGRFPNVDWAAVEGDLPPVIWRSRWDTLADRFGLPYTRRHLANLDCKGQGPASIGAR